jgi:hypothetical protein
MPPSTHPRGIDNGTSIAHGNENFINRALKKLSFWGPLRPVRTGAGDVKVSSMKEDDFYLKVAYALSGCQLVEQELKLYITEALELAQKCIGTRMPFKLSGKDYANSSLEKLIHVFGGLSDNDALVSRLQKFKKERNFLSHQGITHCLDYDGELFLSTAAEFQNRLDAIQCEAEKLRMAIHEEANKFRGHLWFEEFQTEG